MQRRRVCEGQLKDVLFLGTAGFSPRKGGILDPDACVADEALGGGRPLPRESPRKRFWTEESELCIRGLVGS